MKIRNPAEEDFLDIYEFVSNCKPLESYGEHFYKIMLRYFKDTCFVALDNGSIVGYIMGFISQTDNKSSFIWQIGVHTDLKRSGVASKLLDAFEKQIMSKGCQRIELTVDPENPASQKLFENRGYENISETEGETVTVSGKVAVKDYGISENDLKKKPFNQFRNYVFSQATIMSLYEAYSAKGETELTRTIHSIVKPA